MAIYLGHKDRRLPFYPSVSTFMIASHSSNERSVPHGHHTHHAAAHRQGPHPRQGDQRHHRLCKNPDKTDHGRLITSYQCDSRVADAQFLLDKQTYITNLIHSSVDPKTVQYLAGHESSKITMDIYAKVKYNQPDQVVKAMDGAFAQWDAMWA